jgi:DUF4097 and DUF4098 domain-containing protein YvlB
MPTFDTPEPIAITVDVFLGNVKIVASDRTDTVVEVRPSDEAKTDDIRAAKDTTIDFAAGMLTVKAPRGWKMYTPFSGNPSIDVTIQAPTGSQLRGTGSVARFLAGGELGQVELKTSVGDMQLEKAGPVELKTSGGNITVDHATERMTVSTSTGIVRVRAVEGAATIKNSNGDSTVRDISGDLQVNAANGNITVDRARGAVTAKTANGNIRVADVTNGTLRLETSAGEIEIGIHPGSAAWLDVSAKNGAVQNLMTSAEQPADTDDTVKVYARNSFGNIIVRQATSA